MADTFIIGCPECSQQFKVPMTAVGKKVRCKACGELIPVSAPSATTAAKVPSKKAPSAKPTPAPAPSKHDDLDGDGKPYGLTEEKIGARCPECANAMGDGDIVCLKCGYNTRNRQRVGTKKTVDITGNDVFIWLLPGILCVIFLIGVIVWDILHLTKGEEWFKDEWYEFLGSGAARLWNVIVSLFIIFFAGRFAINRLIIHPRPPEIEIRK